MVQSIKTFGALIVCAALVAACAGNNSTPSMPTIQMQNRLKPDATATDTPVQPYPPGSTSKVVGNKIYINNVLVDTITFNATLSTITHTFANGKVGVQSLGLSTGPDNACCLKQPHNTICTDDFLTYNADATEFEASAAALILAIGIIAFTDYVTFGWALVLVGNELVAYLAFKAGYEHLMVAKNQIYADGCMIGS